MTKDELSDREMRASIRRKVRLASLTGQTGRPYRWSELRSFVDSLKEAVREDDWDPEEGSSHGR